MKIEKGFDREELRKKPEPTTSGTGVERVFDPRNPDLKSDPKPDPETTQRLIKPQFQGPKSGRLELMGVEPVPSVEAVSVVKLVPEKMPVNNKELAWEIAAERARAEKIAPKDPETLLDISRKQMEDGYSLLRQAFNVPPHETFEYKGLLERAHVQAVLAMANLMEAKALKPGLSKLADTEEKIRALSLEIGKRLEEIRKHNLKVKK